MQMQIPIFPENTKLINPTLGVCQMDVMVYYLHNGSPIFCHYVKDMKSYRYIPGNLVEIKLCKNVSGVSEEPESIVFHSQFMYQRFNGTHLNPVGSIVCHVGFLLFGIVHLRSLCTVGNIGHDHSHIAF